MEISRKLRNLKVAATKIAQYWFNKFTTPSTLKDCAEYRVDQGAEELQRFYV
jgi:hypothetical protein